VEKRTKTENVRTCIKEGCDWEIAVPESEQKEAAPEEVSVSGKP